MKLIYILFFVYIISKCNAQLNPPGCGRRPLIGNDKIVGGTEAIPGDWGWQVSMQYYGYHYCGGSLIHKSWVLLAAHCIYGDYDVESYGIRIGAHHREDDEVWTQYRDVSRIILHPTYNHQTAKNDLALMKLSTPVEFDNKYIVTICISNNTNLDNQMGWATGWGTTSTGSLFGSNVKLQVEMPILANNVCKAKYDPWVDTISQICAGIEGDGKDTCQGDSGGPLVYKNLNDGLWYLAGVTSWGYECGDGGVYIRVSNYIDWIQQNINKFP